MLEGSALMELSGTENRQTDRQTDTSSLVECVKLHSTVLCSVGCGEHPLSDPKCTNVVSCVLYIVSCQTSGSWRTQILTSEVVAGMLQELQVLWDVALFK
jgi:hypothetical protein